MIKIGMIGAGAIGMAHSDAILENSECKLSAVCDVDIKKAEQISEKHEAKVFTDYKDVVDVDAVIINLPHYLHCEVTCYFLEKGIDVLVEKPMANTPEECDKMIETARKYDAKLAVGHVQRYYSAVREVKKIIESEKLGKLSMIREVRNTNYLSGRPGWFLEKEKSGGGIVMNYGAHSLDRIFYTTGKRVKSVHSLISNPISRDDVEINAQMLFELEGGISAGVTLCGCRVPDEYEISYYFTNGVLKLKKGSELLMYENDEFVNYGGESNLISEQLKEFVKFLKGEKSEIVTPEYGREIVRILKEIV